ncbi:MAG: tRNA dihydrouridine synthase DusB [Clostridiales bacterium]|nr:tRNA dihydrouridine synthase DusB [Clostridiales bacterium]
MMILKIGGLIIDGFASLAPMAGVADRAFRELCKEYGAAFTVGEMASAKGITYNDRKSSELLSLTSSERPAAIQLFGHEPDVMADALLRAMKYEPDFVDINMGCPAPKVAGNGGGSALMKDPHLCGEIVKACVKVSPVPVTVKMRTGWDDNSINAIEVAKICEDAGAAAITVHGRTRAQMYSPPVNMDVIRDVKKAVSIPVIGNGDVTDGKSALNMLEYTGCDFLAVGRGSLGRPWVFEMINKYLRDGTVMEEPPVEERMAVMVRHIKKLCLYKGDRIGIKEARKHAAWYIKGQRGAASFRNEIGAISSIDELECLAEKVIKST